MADTVDKSKRSEIMSRIRSRENKATELALVAAFRRNGIIGWRRHQPLFGKPDFVFRQQRVAIFVDGCFWHGCPKHGSVPDSNRAFWKEKLARNAARDRLVNKTLKRGGWRVLRIWQHELARKNEARLVSRIRRHLAMGNWN